MKNILTRIRQSLSLKLSVIILVCVTVVFVLSLGFQSIHSRHIIREEAIDRGERVLEVTSQRIKGVMEEAQVVTRNMEWMVKANVQPDSLLEYTNRLLKYQRTFSATAPVSQAEGSTIPILIGILYLIFLATSFNYHKVTRAFESKGMTVS